MSWTKAIAPFAFAAGALLFGPVWTMIIPPDTFVDCYVYGVIDAMLVGFAILNLYNAYRIISGDPSRAG